MIDSKGTVIESAQPRRISRVIADYVELTKPRLTLLSVMTTFAGYYMASGGAIDGMILLHTLLGSFLVGGGCGALNMYIERDYDMQMHRTHSRPIPAGRVGATEALVYGLLLSVSGLVYLAVAVNLLTSILGAATLVSYVLLYTPMKRLSTLNTVVGAIPGALPPVMGWAAARNDLAIVAGPDLGWLVLFGILFFWQMPHFFALAWMCRRDYERAGYRMLTLVDPDGSITSRHILLYTAALIPVSLLPTFVGMAGTLYFFVALALGIAFFVLGLLLAAQKENRDAKSLFYYSLLYLPILLIVLGLDS